MRFTAEIAERAENTLRVRRKIWINRYRRASRIGATMALGSRGGRKFDRGKKEITEGIRGA
jgi:hypothetical protein